MSHVHVLLIDDYAVQRSCKSAFNPECQLSLHIHYMQGKFHTSNNFMMMAGIIIYDQVSVGVIAYDEADASNCFIHYTPKITH